MPVRLSTSQKITIGVVGTAIVLSVVVVLVWYFFFRHASPPSPPPAPQNYQCIDGQCKPCTDCPVQSLDACQASCAKSWDCTSTQCVGRTDDQGKFKTLGACRQSNDCAMPSTCWLKTQDSLVVTPENVAQNLTLTDINQLLSQKDQNGNNLIYGQDMVVQCGSEDADPDDQWSRQFCKSKQLFVCQYDPTKPPPYGKCQPFFSAVGTQLRLHLQNNKTLAQRSDRTFANLTSSSCLPNTTFYRGVCLPNTKPVRWTATSRPYGMVLYHGGKSGLPEFDTRCAASYFRQLAQFANEKNFNRVFLSVDSPQPTKQNPYFLQPQFLAKHFLANLNSTSYINSQKVPTEAGIIVYANPDDSSWNFQSQTPSQDVQNTCKEQWTQDSDLFPLHDASMCFSNPWASNLMGGNISDPTKTSCSDYAFQPLGTNPVCKINCGADCSSTYCPNVASQVVAYVTAVNQAVDQLIATKQVSADCPKLSFIGYDGEDAKADKDNGGQCQFTAMVNQLDKNLKITNLKNIPTKLGWAFSMSAGPFDLVNSSTTSSFVMPELYWYMGANWPCLGSAQEYTQLNNVETNVPTCTTQMVYRDVLANNLSPSQFYHWLVNIQPCVTQITGGEPHGKFIPLHDNLVKYPGQVWPMYSSESLSAQDSTYPANEQCLARVFNGNQTQPKICGTADMLYTWSWDQIQELYDTTYRDLFLDAFGNYNTGNIVKNYTPYLAFYEAQFVNPKWLNAQQFDPSLTKDCVLNQFCHYCQNGKPVKCTSSDTCQCTSFTCSNPTCNPKSGNVTC